MKISYKCTYIGKPSGFEDTTYEQGGRLVASPILGLPAKLLNKQYGPIHACMLLSGDNGQLSTLVTGIGRERYGSQQRIWRENSNSEVINVVFEAESVAEHNLIFSIFLAFSRDYVGLGGKLISALEPVRNGSMPEYDIPKDAVDALVAEVKSEQFCATEYAKSSLLLYYSPMVALDSKEAKALVSSLASSEIGASSKCILKSPEKYEHALTESTLSRALKKIRKTIFD